MNPISLYIHIPFCTSKCHYCSFNSITGKSRYMAPYVTALLKEMAYYELLLKGRQVTTLFFGGGTPSLLSGDQIQALVEAARDRFEWAADVEVSLESNPGTLDLEKLKQYYQAGVNRISMGVQSFDSKELRWLGRTHGVDEVFEGVANIKQAGFDNFNLDLIFGLPEQTLNDWQQTVEQALKLGSTHISLYHLTIEPESTFGDIKKLPDPSQEMGATLFNWTKQNLEAAGFEQYEISNYARKGYRCRHNETYWQNRDSIGIGAGAWTYFQGKRYLRPKTIEAYIKDVENQTFERIEEETLDLNDSIKETLVFGLRTKDGVDLNRLEKRYSRSLDKETVTAIDRLIDQGLLLQEKDQLRLTNKGFLFADTVAVELI